MKALEQCLLYGFVDTAFLRGRAPVAVARALCEGGADIIQLRAKESSPVEIIAMAKEIIPITRHAGVGLVINDYPEIARESGAEFCHLGQEDFFDAGQTRVSQVGSLRGLGIGLSTHSPDQAARALAAGPDYIAIGPVYATGTKPGAKPVTLDYVKWAASNVTLPWFAIGGINLDNLDEVLAAGARRICVVSAILNADDVAKECREFKLKLAAYQSK